MKPFFLSLFLVFFCSLFCLAQATRANPAKKSQRVIVLSGGGMNISRSQFQQSVLLTIETPVGNFWNLGILGGYVLKKESDNRIFKNGGSEYNFLGGFEAGGFAKHFLRGRLSGRKSEFYFGPEFRYSAIYSEGEFYGGIIPSYYTFKSVQRAQNYLIRWGLQWKPGRRTLLDIAIPIGWQRSTIATSTTQNEITYTDVSRIREKFMMFPSILIGFAF